MQRFHDNRLDTQIVTPHLLDQFGVVDTFHPDPAGPCNLGPQTVDVTEPRPIA